MKTYVPREGRFVLGVATLLIILAAGCAQSPTAPAPPPAPQPTQQEILAELRQCVAPLISLVVTVSGTAGWGDNGRGAAAFLSDDVRAQVLSCLKGAKAKYENSEDVKAALSEIGADLEKAIHDGYDQQRWRVVLCGIDAYEILSPGALKIQRLRERAQARANRPEVVVKGFLEDKEKNEVFAFLQVTLHPSNEVRRVQVRKGEEFCGLRLVDFIGKLKGVLLENLDIPGETFRAMGP